MTISLKEFTERVESRISSYSKKELESILKEMSFKILAEDRESFLETLTPVDEVSYQVENIISKDTLLEEIYEIKALIKADMEKFHENQHLYMEYYHKYRYHDYEECREYYEGPYEKYFYQISDLFDRTQSVFEGQDFDLAYKAYIELFQILTEEDDSGDGIREHHIKNINIKDQIIYAIRALYESTELEKRANRMFEYLNIVYYKYSFFHSKEISLQNIIDAHEISLSDKDKFLADWIKLLKKHKEKMCEFWLREAVLLKFGVKALKKFALENGENQPRAYLEWILYYFEKKKFEKAIDAAYTAIENLSKNIPVKSAIGDLLYKAASEIDNKEAMQDGLWESYINKPTLNRLLNLVENKDLKVISSVLQKAKKIAKKYKTPKNNNTYELFHDDKYETPVNRSEKLITHLEILNKKFSNFIKTDKNKEISYWSSDSSSQSILIPAILMIISNMNSKSYFNIQKLWDESMRNSFSWDNEEEDSKRLEALYKLVFVDYKFKKQDKINHLESCSKMAHQKIQKFLDDKARGSYEEGAMLIAACAEALLASNEKEKAHFQIAKSFENGKRFSAYKRELKEAIKHHLNN